MGIRIFKLRKQGMLSVVIVSVLLIFSLSVLHVSAGPPFPPTDVDPFFPPLFGGDSYYITKTVYDTYSSQWVKTMEANVGDVVTFTIEITAGTRANDMHDIQVMDWLPVGMEFISASPAPDDIYTYADAVIEQYSLRFWKLMYWDLGSLNLKRGESTIISLTAQIVECIDDQDSDDDFLVSTNTAGVYANATVFDTGCNNPRPNTPIEGYDSAMVQIVCEEPSNPGIQVTKVVAVGCDQEFYDHVEVEHNEYVKFRIQVVNNGDVVLDNVTVKDFLPDGLLYASSVAPRDPDRIESFADGVHLYWYFEDVAPGWSEEIVFYAETVGCGSHVNVVNVTGVIFATSTSVYDEDEASVYIICEEPSPAVRIEKKVKDCDTWRESVTVRVEDNVEFKLTITNIGDIKLDEFVHVVDDLPSFLTYNQDANLPPTSSDAHHIEWNNLAPLGSGESIVITFSACATVQGEADNVAIVEAKYDEIPAVSDEDTAHVIVDVESGPAVELTKKVKNGDIWADGVTVDVEDTVEFKLVVTNTGTVPLDQYVHVVDDLPSFLTYNYDAVPAPSATSDHHIEWNLGLLASGKSKTITFSARADAAGDADNVASVEAKYDCNPPVSDGDTAHVIVQEPGLDVKVNKMVAVNCQSTYYEQVEVEQEGSVKFRIKVENSGDVVLDNVTVQDALPDGLIYANSATPREPDRKESYADGVYLYWYFEDVAPGWTKTIVFHATAVGCGSVVNGAKVTGTVFGCPSDRVVVKDEATVHILSSLQAEAGDEYTGFTGETISLTGSAVGGKQPYSFFWDLDNDGQYDDATGHSPLRTWDTAGTFTVGVRVTDTAGLNDTDRAQVSVEIRNRAPEAPQKPSGETSGRADNTFTYSTVAVDENNDAVYFLWDWDDGTTSNWHGPYESGKVVEFQHIWTEKGEYMIRVKAKDVSGAESMWSESVTVTVRRSFSSNTNEILSQFSSAERLFSVVQPAFLTVTPEPETSKNSFMR